MPNAPDEVVAAPLTLYLAPVGTAFPLIDDLPADFDVAELVASARVRSPDHLKTEDPLSNLLRRFVEKATTTSLAAAITPSDTTIVVEDGSAFPASDFDIYVTDGGYEEIIHVGSRSGNTFSSLTRGREADPGSLTPACPFGKHASVLLGLSESNIGGAASPGGSSPLHYIRVAGAFNQDPIMAVEAILEAVNNAWVWSDFFGLAAGDVPYPTTQGVEAPDFAGHHLNVAVIAAQILDGAGVIGGWAQYVSAPVSTVVPCDGASHNVGLVLASPPAWMDNAGNITAAGVYMLGFTMSVDV